MTPEDKHEIQQAVAEGIKEGMTQHAQTDEGAKRKAFYIEPERHHVEHGYIRGQRNALGTIRKGSLWALGASICALIIWFVQSILIIAPPTP